MIKEIAMILKTLFGIVFDFGQFEGIKKMELSDVIILKSICEQFIIKESTENKGKQK